MRTILLLFICLMLAGCTPEFIPIPDPTQVAISTPEAGTTRAVSTSISTPDRFDTIETIMPERVPPTGAFPPVTGEVPVELLDSILKDLSERTGIPRERIVVIGDQAVVWNDGSLGCAKPGEFYTQAQVNGYWVIVGLDGAKYDYRAAATGYFLLCDRGIPPAPPGTPSS